MHTNLKNGRISRRTLQRRSDGSLHIAANTLSYQLNSNGDYNGIGSSRMGAGGRNDSATGRRRLNEGDHRGGDYVGSNPETFRARTPSPGRGAPRDINDGALTTNAAVHDRQQGGTHSPDPTHNMREINTLRAQTSPAHNPEQARNTERRDNHAGPMNNPDRDDAGNPQ